jgi:hypothetical protein
LEDAVFFKTPLAFRGIVFLDTGFELLEDLLRPFTDLEFFLSSSFLDLFFPFEDTPRSSVASASL